MMTTVHTDDEWANFSKFQLHSKLHQEELDNSEINDHVNDSEDSFVNDTDFQYVWTLQDLVHKCEEKVSYCFKSIPSGEPAKWDQCTGIENMDNLSSNPVWKSITDNYGLVRPLNWSDSHIKEIYMSAIGLESESKPPAEMPNDKNDQDDTELRRQMDLHRLTTYDIPDLHSDVHLKELESIQDEKVQTADEVIQEIEEIMLDADEQDAAFDNALEDETGIIFGDSSSIGEFDMTEEGSLIHSSRTLGSPSSQEESDRACFLKTMSIHELQDELCGMENTVKLLSEELLSQLNLRDELLYEKEVRNTFISKILEVQYKQEQFQHNSKAHSSRFKMGSLSKSFSMSNATSAAQGRFLTTVIPIADERQPSLESIQAMMKLLDAIKEDSDEVPALITNYILKVLCPAPSGTHTLTL